MPSGSWLERPTFLEVVRHAPLVSIDLVVRDLAGALLLGLRQNAPARGHWFVPGGRILKNERLDDAFRRIARTELGLARERRDSRFLGVFEHPYDDNVAGEPGFGTHYVVLAYAFTIDATEPPVADSQHGAFRWWPPDELLGAVDVHPYTKAYLGRG